MSIYYQCQSTGTRYQEIPNSIYCIHKKQEIRTKQKKVSQIAKTRKPRPNCVFFQSKSSMNSSSDGLGFSLKALKLIIYST